MTAYTEAALMTGIAKIDELRAERDRLKEINADLLTALETLMYRWEDYRFLATKEGETEQYLDQALRYGKAARAAIAKATKLEVRK